MTTAERMKTIRMINKINRNPEYSRKLKVKDVSGWINGSTGKKEARKT